MIEFLRELFSSDFMGHGYCYLWKPDIVWLHAVSDGLIALAYYVISVSLVYFVRKRRDLPFHWMFLMFGLFIFGCGTTHAMEVWTLWHGTYRLAGVIKALTAAASMATAVALVPLIPRALLLPSPGQLRAANLNMEREIAERLRADEALRDSEILLKHAQRLAMVGSWERDIGAARIHWSDEMHRIYGMPDAPSDFLALLNQVHPSDRKDLLEKEAKVRSSTAPVDVEFRIIRPDGEVRFVHSIVDAIRNAEGAVVRIVGATQDITEQVRARELLRESEERFRAIFQQAGVGVAQVSLEGKVEEANDRYWEVIGYPKEDLLGKSTLEITHSEDLQERIEMLRRLLAGEIQSYSTEKRYRRKDGAVVWVDMCRSLVKDVQGKPKRFITVVQDITTRKRAEALLRESERRYKEVFDNFSEGIFVLDVTSDGHFKIAGLNSAEEKAIGLSRSEVAGKFIEEVFAEDIAKRLIAHYRHCLEVGTIINYNDELNLPTGPPRFFRTNLIPVRGDDGRICRIVGCCIDFTDLKRNQEEAFARQKLESVGTLAGGIAHDFNNLLGGVLAQTELALAELSDGSPVQELQRIRDAATRGSEIVRQLMIYAGKETEVLELVDVSQMVRAMLDLLRVSVSKHAVLETDLGENLSPIRANAAQIPQIVMNLVINASDAIGNRNGIIRLTTRCVTVNRHEGISEGVAEGDYLQLEVSDTGAGMPPEIQSKVFDPFFSTKSAGRGLGLAVVHGIVRNLHGAIRLTSMPDKGTTFQILLPCAETEVGAAASTIRRTDVAVPACNPAIVLVVEDEDIARHAVTKLLGRKGFEVLEAADGSAAIDVLRAHGDRINAILLDMTIPGLSSSEVLAQAAQIRPDMKVILTTAYSEEMATKMMSGPLIRAFIRKPFRFADLVQTLQKVLEA